MLPFASPPTQYDFAKILTLYCNVALSPFLESEYTKSDTGLEVMQGSIVTETYERSGDYTVLYLDAQLKLPVLLGIKSIFYSRDLKSHLKRMAQVLQMQLNPRVCRVYL